MHSSKCSGKNWLRKSPPGLQLSWLLPSRRTRSTSSAPKSLTAHSKRQRMLLNCARSFWPCSANSTRSSNAQPSFKRLSSRRRPGRRSPLAAPAPAWAAPGSSTRRSGRSSRSSTATATAASTPTNSVWLSIGLGWAPCWAQTPRRRAGCSGGTTHSSWTASSTSSSSKRSCKTLPAPKALLWKHPSPAWGGALVNARGQAARAAPYRSPPPSGAQVRAASPWVVGKVRGTL